jgi:NAD(P)-dependent dehydrogenase (short-subunit alcohol dehydrogenase family)
MKLNLENKVFIVTGGAKGIGRAITKLLIDEGSSVAIIDKDKEAGRELTHQFGKKILFIAGDLSNAKVCEKTVAKIGKHFGRIDGLVNNAGRNDGIGLEKGTPEKFERSLKSNLSHFYTLAHFCVPHLKKTKGGIVNIGSKTSLTGQGNTSGYVAAKGAVLSLTREWAAELLPYSIRVNAVIPAEVWTPLYESWINTFSNPKAKRKEIEKKIPLEHRFTTPEEIASTVVFLLSDRSSHTTGQWIHVDGGYTHLDRALT